MKPDLIAANHHLAENYQPIAVLIQKLLRWLYVHVEELSAELLENFQKQRKPLHQPMQRFCLSKKTAFGCESGFCCLSDLVCQISIIMGKIMGLRLI